MGVVMPRPRASHPRPLRGNVGPRRDARRPAPQVASFPGSQIASPTVPPRGTRMAQFPIVRGSAHFGPKSTPDSPRVMPETPCESKSLEMVARDGIEPSTRGFPCPPAFAIALSPTARTGAQPPQKLFRSRWFIAEPPSRATGTAAPTRSIWTHNYDISRGDQDENVSEDRIYVDIADGREATLSSQRPPPIP